MIYNKTSNKFLTEIELTQIAPSVFALDKSKQLSDSYTQIPTIEIVRGLQKEGYGVVKAMQSNCRDKDKQSHVKHMLRFRKQESIEINGTFPEIVLINSHDGKSSYQLKAGLYRLICSNGLVVGNDLINQRVLHKGNIVHDVIEKTAMITHSLPEVLETMQEWKNIQLDNYERLALADSARALKWDDDQESIKPAQLLTPKRQADDKRDVWTTFNVIQEHLIRGGLRYRKENGQRQSTRGVNSVTENARLNTALWKLTEALANHVK